MSITDNEALKLLHITPQVAQRMRKKDIDAAVNEIKSLLAGKEEEQEEVKTQNISEEAKQEEPVVAGIPEKELVIDLRIKELKKVSRKIVQDIEQDVDDFEDKIRRLNFLINKTNQRVVFYKNKLQTNLSLQDEVTFKVHFERNEKKLIKLEARLAVLEQEFKEKQEQRREIISMLKEELEHISEMNEMGIVDDDDDDNNNLQTYIDELQNKLK